MRVGRREAPPRVDADAPRIEGIESMSTHGIICVMPQLHITDQKSQTEADRRAWRRRTPEERLDEVERLRVEAGKFLYEYPTRLRRLLSIARIERR